MDVQYAVLEFFGTFVWLLMALGGIQSGAAHATLQASDQGQHHGRLAPSALSVEQLMYDAAVLGLSLLVACWLFYRATGGLFNPNITTALWLVGVIGPVRWALCCFAQMIGATCASAVLLALMPGPIAFNTSPSPGINKAQAVFMEMFMTAFLVLAVLMLAAEKSRTTPFAPIGIGLTLFACELWGLNWTGGSLNTARSFGPAVISGFTSTHWIYWLGPFLGSLLATAFYTLLKHIEYWRLNPTQEETNYSKSPQNPVHAITGKRSEEVDGPDAV
ncbi:hypothetical protein FRB96_000507 [Tulasnella sp. 330]|nr:hypothetical protein FRB96_000507 [Tulasnella sp. 330]KAG8872253.1 hypothetical protein FRB97_007828 [Tulasnella sp. 331]KAG8877745.1 hypothetical protein FRB98_006562 [Tulasnella sp. 332]